MEPNPIIQFANNHHCTISPGTCKFDDREATNYPELPTFFKRLDSAGYTFKTERRGLTQNQKSNRFEVEEFFNLARESGYKFTAILMSGGYIEDQGAMAMASYIAETENLQVLDFHFSRVTENGMRLIINALKINKSIMLINLRSNTVTPAIGEELLDLVINHNHTIRQMCLVQRTSFPADPKPSVELEKAIHAQIIANAKEYDTIVNLARVLFLFNEFKNLNSFFSYFPPEVCCTIVAYCSTAIPLEAARKIVKEHFCKFPESGDNNKVL